MHRRRGRAVRTAGACGVLAACLSACAKPGVDVDTPVPVLAPDGSVIPGPFAPASMRIHPLTTIERDQNGQAQVVLHVELRDAWGDVIKGMGTLRVQLLRPTGLGGGGPERVEIEWELDLGDLDANVRHYDPSTRTYRVLLGNLPAWAAALAPAGEAEAPSRGVDRFAVVVLFTTRQADGRETVMRDRFVVRGRGG